MLQFHGGDVPGTNPRPDMSWDVHAWYMTRGIQLSTQYYIARMSGILTCQGQGTIRMAWLIWGRATTGNAKGMCFML